MMPRRIEQDNHLENDKKLTREEIIKNAKKWILESFDIIESDIERNDFYNVMGTLEEMLYHATTADTVIRVLKK